MADVPTPAMAAGSDSERWGKLLTVGVALRTLPFFWYGISQKTTGATQTPAGDRRLRSRAGAGTGYGTQATASRYLEENVFLLEPTSTTGRGSAARPRPRPGDACRSIAPMTDVSQIGRNYRHAMETSHGRSDGRSDAGYGRKIFSPRTDLDDRPRLGGKTPPSPGRRVPVDSPEDRRFSNRSKSHRRCRHAMETSHGRSDGRSDAGYAGRVRLGTAGYAPTGFRKNRVNGGSNYGSRTCVYVSSDFHIGKNRVADAGTRRKLRTNVPSDVPAPAIDAPSGFRKNRVNGGSNYDSRTCVYVSSDFYIFRNHVPDASIRRKLGMEHHLDVTMHYIISISL